MKTVFRGILLFAAVLLLTDGVFAQQYEFRNFSQEHGLAQPFIYSLSQDSTGNLWVGTGDGLTRFNGKEFVTFNITDSLSDNFITSSLAEGENIWFGHMNGTLSLYDGKEFKTVRHPERNLSRITQISNRPDGSIWISTMFDGFFRIDAATLSFRESIISSGNIVNSFAFHGKGGILAATGAGLLRFAPDGRSEVLGMIPRTKIVSVINTSGPEYIVAAENGGFYRLTAAGEEFTAVTLVRRGQVRNVQGVCPDHEGNIWVATFGSGLVRISFDEGKTGIVSFNKRSGYPSDNVKLVWRDMEGLIWGGNFGEGLTRVMPKTAILAEFDPLRHGSQVFSVCADNEKIWAGTAKGLFILPRGSLANGSPGTAGTGLPADTVTALFRSEDDVFAGTNSHGLFRISGGRSSAIGIPGSPIERSITALSADAGFIFAGTKKGLCVIDRKTGEIVTRYTISNGLPHNYVNGLYSDRDGNLWITTRSNVVSVLKDGKIERMPVSRAGAFSAGPVTGDWGSGIWVGTSGNGVLVFGADSVMQITSRQGLYSDYCYSIHCDGRYVWVGHRGGLSRIDTGDFTIKNITAFGNHSGLHFSVNAAASLDGMAIFGSDKGIAAYDEPAELPGSEPFMPSITSLWINDDETDPRARVDLPAGKYRFRFRYLGVSLRSPELVRYQTRLKGSEEEWSELTFDNSVTYSGLTGGKYTFMLRSYSADGVVVRRPLEFEFTIKQPVWKMWWFFPAIALVLGILLLYYLKWKERLHRQEKRILEEKVKERTSEIERQKNELALQRDEIDVKNQNILASITYARQIQTAILPPREVLDRTFPQNFVLHKPRDIVSGDFYWMAEKDKKVVFSVADCTGHGVPGAFMSLLGITLLNDIVNVNGIVKSDQIIRELRNRLVQALLLNKSRYKAYDGMEIALCVYDPKTRVVQFTGGMNHMIRVRNGKLEVIKADHMDVSIAFRDIGDFTMKEVDCRKDDMIYLFSDGYQDQFGGEFNKKFLRPHFYTMLLEVHALPAQKQKEILESRLMDWMKDHPQTDDITILGIRI